MMKIVASALSDRKPDPEENEAPFLTDDSLGLSMACDGPGGHSAGKVAGDRAVDFASEHVSSPPNGLGDTGTLL